MNGIMNGEDANVQEDVRYIRELFLPGPGLGLGNWNCLPTKQNQIGLSNDDVDG